jgi:uncharacterized repeat protein (TIGR01451 family)
MSRRAALRLAAREGRAEAHAERAATVSSRRALAWPLALLFVVCLNSEALAVGEDNLLYGVSFAPSPRVFVINQTNGVATSVGNLSFGSAAVARRPSNGVIYYTEYELDGASAGRVATFNPLTGVNTIINAAGFSAQMVRLAFNSSGTLYAMDAANRLFIVNTGTGAFALLGTVTGLPAATGGGDLAFPPTSATTGYILTNGNLYTVNITTRVATLVGATGIANPTGLCFGMGGLLYATNLAVDSTVYTINPATGASEVIGLAGININDLTAMPKFANLSVTKTAVGSFVVNYAASYHLTVSNAGPQAATGPITITDTIPNGLTYTGFSGTNWTCANAAPVVTCTHPGPVNNGASLPQLTINVSVAEAAAPSVTNTASVASTTFDHVDPSTDSVTTPVLYIKLVKSYAVNGTYAAPGTDLTYTIAFQNLGGAGVQNLSLVDMIPYSTDYKVGTAASSYTVTPTISFSNVARNPAPSPPPPTPFTLYTPTGTYDPQATWVRWSFAGSVPQGASGSVTFTVRIQ